jgi:autotransporter-associated beta strand protein
MVSIEPRVKIFNLDPVIQEDFLRRDFAAGTIKGEKMKHRTSIIGTAGLALAGLCCSAYAANVSLTTGDSIGASSFNSAGRWSNAAAPSTGNDYFVNVSFLRSPVDAVSYTFGGDSLTIQSSGAYINKANGTRTLTANWILDGGLMRGGGAGQLETIAGTMAVTSNGGQILGDQNPWAVSAATTLNGALNLNATSYAITHSGSLAGAGSIVKNGAQALTLSGANSMSGNMTLNSGNVNLNGTSTMSGNINVSSGSGTVSVNGDYSGFTGTYTHNSSTVSSVFYGTQTLSANAAYVINAPNGSTQGILLGNVGGGTYRMGSLSGIASSMVRNVGAATGVNTLEVGNLGTDTEFAGIIGGGGGTMALTKVGNGKLTLSGASTFTGGTAVTGGELEVDGSLQGNVTVSAGAAISGDGSIAGSLTLADAAQFAFDGASSLTVGSLALANTFGVDDLLIDWVSLADGTYTLVDVTGDFSNIENFGLANAYDLGGGRSAYFQNGSLQLVVIPEPATIGMFGIVGAIMLFIRRRFFC